MARSSFSVRLVSSEPEEKRPHSLAALRYAWTLALLLCGSLLSGFVAAASDPFEAVPDRSPSNLLPAKLSAGSDFHVLDPVHGDGLMYLFVTDSRFGKFTAYGRVALELRVREIHALTELAKTSNVEIVAGGVEHGMESELKTAVGVISNPVGTVAGIPKGIAHLFHGYTAQGQEIVADARRAEDSSGSAASTRNDLDKGAAAAKRTLPVRRLALQPRVQPGHQRVAGGNASGQRVADRGHGQSELGCQRRLVQVAAGHLGAHASAQRQP